MTGNNVSKVSGTRDFAAVRKDKFADGTFAVPVDWMTGRPEKDVLQGLGYVLYDPKASKALMYDTETVAMWKFRTNGVFPYVQFRDSFAPYGATRGTLVCFKEPVSGNTMRVIADRVKEAKETRAEKEMEILKTPSYAPDFLEFVHFKWVVASGTATLFYSSFFMTDVAQYGLASAIIGVMLFCTAMMVAAMTVGMVVTLGQETIRKRKRKALQRDGRIVKEISARKILAIDNRKRKIAENDEVFFVGDSSLVPEVVKISGSYATLVREKLRVNPSGAELQAWCQTVIEIEKIQKNLKSGFPVEMIPSMNKEAVDVLHELKETVNKLEQDWADEQLKEDEAVNAGLSITESYAVDDSKAVREGASRFLSGLAVDEYNPGV